MLQVYPIDNSWGKRADILTQWDVFNQTQKWFYGILWILKADVRVLREDDVSSEEFRENIGQVIECVWVCVYAHVHVCVRVCVSTCVFKSTYVLTALFRHTKVVLVWTNSIYTDLFPDQGQGHWVNSLLWLCGNWTIGCVHNFWFCVVFLHFLLNLHLLSILPLFLKLQHTSVAGWEKWWSSHYVFSDCLRLLLGPESLLATVLASGKQCWYTCVWLCEGVCPEGWDQ